MSILYSPWTSQPQQAVGIDSSIVPSVKSTILLPPRRMAETSGGSGNVSIIATSEGFAASGGPSRAFETATAVSGYPFCFIGVLMARDVSSNNVFTTIGDVSSDGGRIQIDVSSGSLRAIAVGSQVISDSVSISANKFYRVVFVGRSATDRKLFVNGQMVSSSTSSVTFSSSWTKSVFLGGANPTYPNGTQFIDGAISLGAWFQHAPSDALARQISQNPWQIFKPLPRRIFVPVAAAAGVTINAGTGNATAAGLTASVTQSGAPVTISAGVGNAVATGLAASVSQAASISTGVGNAAAAGLTASVAQQYTLSAGIGNAAAAGLTATITASGLTTISCSVGNAAAAGATASLSSTTTITCTKGNAAAAGLTAALDIAFTILANVGNATGAGLSATIQAATGISCGVANAIAAGLTASITNNAPLTDSEKLDLILDILSNRQTLNPATGVYTLYADDGVTVLKTAQAWEDAAGTIPYRGRALQRLDAMN